MSAELLRRAAVGIRQDCPIPEASRALDFIDYPAAWALQKEGSTAHDERCSATQTGGGMLCDCEALLPPWVKWKTLLAVADWLEEAADHLLVGEESDTLGDPCPTALEGPDCSVLGQALAVARAYLGIPA